MLKNSMIALLSLFVIGCTFIPQDDSIPTDSDTYVTEMLYEDHIKLLFNLPDYNFTMDIKGDDIGLVDFNGYSYLINGKVIRVELTPIAQFHTDTESNLLHTKDILLSHQQYVTDHLTKPLGVKVHPTKEFVTINKDECLYWKYQCEDIPEHQFISKVIHNHVIVINGVVMARYTSAEIKQFLIETLSSVKLLEGPIDENSLKLTSRGIIHRIEIEGMLRLILILDRDYEIVGVKTLNGNKRDINSWIFYSADDQSSANMYIGKDLHHKTEEDISRLYEGAKVTKHDGVINGTKVTWRRWKDSLHLYSDCFVILKDASGNDRAVKVFLVANMKERLISLEDAFSLIGIMSDADK